MSNMPELNRWDIASILAHKAEYERVWPEMLDSAGVAYGSVPRRHGSADYTERNRVALFSVAGFWFEEAASLVADRGLELANHSSQRFQHLHYDNECDQSDIDNAVRLMDMLGITEQLEVLRSYLSLMRRGDKAAHPRSIRDPKRRVRAYDLHEVPLEMMVDSSGNEHICFESDLPHSDGSSWWTGLVVPGVVMPDVRYLSLVLFEIAARVRQKPTPGRQLRHVVCGQDTRAWNLYSELIPACAQSTSRRWQLVDDNKPYTTRELQMAERALRITTVTPEEMLRRELLCLLQAGRPTQRRINFTDHRLWREPGEIVDLEDDDWPLESRARVDQAHSWWLEWKWAMIYKEGSWNSYLIGSKGYMASSLLIYEMAVRRRVSEAASLAKPTLDVGPLPGDEDILPMLGLRCVVEWKNGANCRGQRAHVEAALQIDKWWCIYHFSCNAIRSSHVTEPKTVSPFETAKVKSLTECWTEMSSVLTMPGPVMFGLRARTVYVPLHSSVARDLILRTAGKCWSVHMRENIEHYADRISSVGLLKQSDEHSGRFMAVRGAIVSKTAITMLMSRAYDTPCEGEFNLVLTALSMIDRVVVLLTHDGEPRNVLVFANPSPRRLLLETIRLLENDIRPLCFEGRRDRSAEDIAKIVSSRLQPQRNPRLMLMYEQHTHTLLKAGYEPRRKARKVDDDDVVLDGHTPRGKKRIAAGWYITWNTPRRPGSGHRRRIERDESPAG